MCGNTTNPNIHLKLNHIEEHSELQRRRAEEREREEGAQGNAPTPAARTRQTSIMEALQRGRQYPGIWLKHITVPITGIYT